MSTDKQELALLKKQIEQIWQAVMKVFGADGYKKIVLEMEKRSGK